MRFGPVRLDQAHGAVLAHSHRLPGRTLRKGLVLDDGAVAALRAAGLAEVVAAQLDPGDLTENEAAARIGAALRTPGLGHGRAATGRLNLTAERAGLLRVDAAQLDRLNALDEALTLATLPDRSVVGAGEMVATVKVIPFAVPGPVVAQAEARIADAAGLLRLHPFRPLRVGLVLTELPGLKPGILDGTIRATRMRVEGLTGRLLPPLRCPHEADAVSACLGALLRDGAELLLVAGASAVVDRRDVAPDGIVRTGGEIVRLGMPVDPGNLICLGRIGAVPAIVLPGCARSPRPNGIDWVLRLLFAGLPVDGATLAGMGAGGLLQDMPARGLPRAAATAPPAVAAVVLAAGLSRRMAPHNKLLLTDAAGRTLVGRSVDAALASAARPVVVVTGHQADAVEASLAGRDIRLVRADGYADGLSASLKAGIAALPRTARAAIICLGDMPLLDGATIDRLIAAYDPQAGRLIVVPTADGRRGNPVLWDRGFFPQIAQLTGDAGARALFDRYPDALTEVACDASVLRDIDTPTELTSLRDRKPLADPA